MLFIQITKRKDGGGVLRCTRADGSVTWQKQSSRHAPFFALHDLTHFAVECRLGFRCGFYGLIAQGWEIDDTTGKGTRKPLPAEAVEVESFVGLLGSERASETLLTTDEFNESAATQAAAAARQVPRLVSTEDLARVRELRSKWFARWSSMAPGETLELYYESPPFPHPISRA